MFRKDKIDSEVISMLQEAQAIQHYLQYLGQKYIAPHKALDEEEFMLQFKQDGGKARNQFKKIVEAFNDQQNLLKMQRVSNWMNQAQFGTPLFYCFFRGENDEMSYPGMAVRLYIEGQRLGLTWEGSVLERTLAKDSLARQRQVLTVPSNDAMYYLAFSQGEPFIYSGTEDNRIFLKKAVDVGEVRKVLVKSLIGFFDEFQTMDDLIEAMNQQFERLFPYYLATK